MLQALSWPGTTVCRDGSGSPQEISHWEKELPHFGEKTRLGFPSPAPSWPKWCLSFPAFFTCSLRQDGISGENLIFLMKCFRTEQGRAQQGFVPVPLPRLEGNLQPHPEFPHGLGGGKPLQ